MPVKKPDWVGEGNINLFTRPYTRNPDNSVSSLYSTSFGDDQGETLVPGVERHGGGIFRKPSGEFDPAAAAVQYRRSGEFLGKFKSPEESNTYAEQLHKDAEQGLYRPPLASSRRDVDPANLGKVLRFLLTREK